MRSVMGLLRPKHGTIRFNGRDITSLPPYKRARAEIGYLPQGRNIFPHLSVQDNLLLASKPPINGASNLSPVSQAGSGLLI
jgi:urea transport system ATP-binding protein